MNRYRAWIIKEKRMVDVVSIDYREPLGIYFQAKNNKELLDGLTKGFILMMSTVIENKIFFDGDIFIYSNPIIHSKFPINTKFEIFYNEKLCRWDIKNRQGYQIPFNNFIKLVRLNGIEIIGNIYQPELVREDL